jgi:4-amino-4-deoxy-L-arabinose transferase-like glycosyltransferase
MQTAQTPQNTKRQRYGAWIAVALIALAALLIRVWGMRGGLPYVDHPDEPNPINYVIRMLKTGDPNPHAFQKPSLYVYWLLAILQVHYQQGLASGLYAPLNEMTITTHLYTTLPGFFLWGRALTISIAVLSVVFLYRIARRLEGNATALIAIAILAVSSFHLRHSQYVTTDVASGWLVLLCFGASIAVAQGGRWRDYLAAGAFAGLAASTKYNAGVACLMVAAAHLIYWYKTPQRQALIDSIKQSPRLFAAAIAAIVGFFAGTPYAALSWPQFWRGITGQVEDYSGITHGDFVDPWNWRGYLWFFTQEGFGWFACALILLGLGIWLKRSRGVALVWLSFVIPYLLLHMMQASHFTRNMIAVFVLCLIPLATAIVQLAHWASHMLQQRGQQLAKPAGIALGLILSASVIVPQLSTSVAYAQRMQRGDTRVQAERWIEQNVPPGVRVAAEMRPQPGPQESRWAEAMGLLRHDMQWFRQQGYAYVIASSDAWKQWEEPQDYKDFAGQAPIADFGGDTPKDMLGPRLVIYETGFGIDDIPDPLPEPAQVGGAKLLGLAIGQPDPKAIQLGVDPTREFRAGDIMGVRTFWQVEEGFDKDYIVFLHVLDAQGNRPTQRDTPPWQGRFPTSTWQSGTIVVDVSDIALPALPPGEYTLALGMYEADTFAQPPMSYLGQPVVRIEAATIRIVE